MNRNVWILVVIILGIGAVLQFQRLPFTAPEAQGATSHEVSLYMKNAKIRQFGQDGKLRYLFLAEQTIYRPDQGITELQQPLLRIYREGEGDITGAGFWEIQANTGQVLGHPKGVGSMSRQSSDAMVASITRIILQGDVTMHQTRANNRSIRFSTERLTIEPATRHAVTSMPVTIKLASGEITGYGMDAYLKTGKFVLYGDQRGPVASTYSSPVF